VKVLASFHTIFADDEDFFLQLTPHRQALARRRPQPPHRPTP
jgi:hypothetical protein